MVSSLSHGFSDSCLIDLVNYAKMYLQVYYMLPQTHICQTERTLWSRLIKLPTPAVEPPLPWVIYSAGFGGSVVKSYGALLTVLFW